MDAQARSKLILELTTERDERNVKAAELERRAAMEVSRDEKSRLVADAREFREGAREANRRLGELDDDEIHDDDRGSVT